MGRVSDPGPEPLPRQASDLFITHELLYPLWAVLYALLFVYAELYWAWRSLQAHGPDLFFFLTTLAGLWWLGLFAYRQWLRRSTLSETA